MAARVDAGAPYPARADGPLAVSPSHPMLQSPLRVTGVHFRSHDSKDLTQTAVSGKKKRGAVFILPRDKILGADGEETEHDVSMMDHVFPEFSQIARQKGIKKHKCKVTNRSYMYHFQDPR